MMGAIKRFYDKVNATLTSGGSSNAYTLTYSVAPSGYVTGERFFWKANHTNNGAATVNVNALGAKSIKQRNGSDLAANTIVSGAIVETVYDGTNMQLVAGGGTSTGQSILNAADVAAVRTFLEIVDPTPPDVVKLHDAAVSAQTNVDFTTAGWFDGTYKQLHFYLTNLTVSSAGSNFTSQVSNDGGSSWISSAGAYGRAIVGAQGSGGAAAATIDTNTSMQLLSDVATTASENNTVIFKLVTAPNVSTYHQFEAVLHYLRHNGGSNVFNISQGTLQHRNASSVVSGLRFSISSGTWSANNVRVYGFK